LCVRVYVGDAVVSNVFRVRVIQMSSWLGKPRITLSDIQEHSCSTKSKKECGMLSCFPCELLTDVEIWIGWHICVIWFL